MDSADFYIGTGPDAEWLGHISAAGSAAEMDERNLFGPADDNEDHYSEGTYRRIVERVLDDAWADELGWSPAHGDATRSPELPTADRVYAFVSGAVNVFERGTDMAGTDGYLLVAVHYPNGARKVTEFPA